MAKTDARWPTYMIELESQEAQLIINNSVRRSWNGLCPFVAKKRVNLFIRKLRDVSKCAVAVFRPYLELLLFEWTKQV